MSSLSEAQLESLKAAHDRVDHYQPVYGLETDPNEINDARKCLARCQLLERHLGPDLSTTRILDVGCASGYMALYFAERGSRVTAIDRNSNNIAFCRVLSKTLGIRAQFELETLPPSFADRLEEGRYDAVFILSVLHHVLNEYDQDATREILSAVVTKSDRVYLELAQKTELVDHKWRDRIPSNDLELLQKLGDLEKIGEFPGIDGVTKRPLYCLSRRVKRFHAFGRTRTAVAAVRLATEFAQRRQAMAFAIRAIMSTPLERSSWRALKLACGISTTTSPAEARTLRAYSPLEFHSQTGAVLLGEGDIPDRIVCIPQQHKEGHCVFGIHYLIEENGHYTATFSLKITEVAIQGFSGELSLVLLEVYENLVLEETLADWEIRPCLLANRSQSYRLHFYAEERQRVEFRIYWRGQCHLTASTITLEKATRV